MVLIKTSSGIETIRGRCGGVYFKGGPEGKHIQAMPRVWNYTRSPAQQGAWGPGSGFLASGLKGYTGAAGIWLMALLAFFSVLWAGYALAHLFMTKKGGPKHITGYNWFIHYSLAYPECERPPFWKPPHAPGVLPSFIVLYKGMWTYEHSPHEWPTDAPTDYYWPGIPYNGKSSYKTDGLAWFLWWKDPVWVLSTGLGFEDPATTYYSPDADIVAYYRNPTTNKLSHVYFGRPEEVDLPH